MHTQLHNVYMKHWGGACEQGKYVRSKPHPQVPIGLLQGFIIQELKTSLTVYIAASFSKLILSILKV